MSFVPVPLDLLEIFDFADHGALVDLYRRGFANRWRAFDGPESELGGRWRCGNHRVRSILRKLVELGRIIVHPGLHRRPNRIEVLCPTRAQHNGEDSPPIFEEDAAQNDEVQQYAQRNAQRNDPGSDSESEEPAAPRAAQTAAPSSKKKKEKEIQGEADEGPVGEQEPIRFPLQLLPGQGPEESPPTSSDLSDGTKVALRAAGIHGSAALTQLTRKQLLELHGIGKKRADEVEAWLRAHGRRLQDAPLDEARIVSACAETWTSVWQESQTGKYPWELMGADRHRLKAWAEALGMPAEMEAARERLARAIRCYLDAVRAGTAWPAGDPPTTRAFTNDVAKWVIAGDRRTEAPKERVNPFDALRAVEGRFKNRKQ